MLYQPLQPQVIVMLWLMITVHAWLALPDISNPSRVNLLVAVIVHYHKQFLLFLTIIGIVTLAPLN